MVDGAPFLYLVGVGVVHKHTQRQYLPLRNNHSLVAAAASSEDLLSPVFYLGWASEQQRIQVVACMDHCVGTHFHMCCYHWDIG